MRAGVEPGIAAAEFDHAQFAQLQVAAVDVSDLEFAAGGRAQAGGDVEHGIVVEIKPRDRPVGQELRGLLDDIDGLFGVVEFDDAILARFPDVIGENRRTVLVRRGAVELGAEAVAIKDVVAEDERNAIVADEVAPENKGVRKPDRLFLNDVVKPDAPGSSRRRADAR